MSRYRLRSRAAEDQEAIGDYIAADSPARAIVPFTLSKSPLEADNGRRRRVKGHAPALPTVNALLVQVIRA